MVRKVYTYPGKANIVVPIPCGRAFIYVTFKDGCLDRKQARPASYSTGDPVLQTIIENSPQFGHRIFLRNTFEIPGTTPKKVAAKPATVPAEDVEQESPAGEEKSPEVQESPTGESKSHEVQEYPEVKSFEEAVAVLKAIPGVKVASLRTPASAKKVAALNAVSFPNYNFE